MEYSLASLRYMEHIGSGEQYEKDGGLVYLISLCQTMSDLLYPHPVIFIEKDTSVTTTMILISRDVLSAT